MDELDILRSQLPEVFAPLSLPANWEDEWLFSTIDAPESAPALASDKIETPENALSTVLPWESDEADGERDKHAQLVPFPALSEVHAGAPVAKWSGTSFPPPDAFAFYLPFHHYHPTWWGVYLIYERAAELARILWLESGHRLVPTEAMIAARVFLSAHGAYHHGIESFAARLEIAHRSPLYREGFAEVAKDGLEETLATAHAYRKAKGLFSKSKKKQDALVEALEIYVAKCRPAPNRALEAAKPTAFRKMECELAERCHRASVRGSVPKSSELWLAFPGAFDGIGGVESRTWYALARGSAFVRREALHQKLFRYRDVVDRLVETARCAPAGDEAWSTRDGKKFSLPRHPGRITVELLTRVLREAGVRIGPKEFLAAVTETKRRVAKTRKGEGATGR